MKTKILIVLSTFLSILTLPAITFEQLAGVYVGKRTETYPTFVMRYDEVMVIEADGRVTNYLFIDELPEPVVATGILALAADGSFTVGENGHGWLGLRGKHLTVTVQFGQTATSSEATVDFRGHRVKKVRNLTFAP